MKAPPLCSNFKAHTARARMSEWGEAQRRRTQIQTRNAELNERDDMWLQTVNSNRNRNCNRSKRRKRNIITTRSPADKLSTAQQLHHHRRVLNLVATGRQQQRLKKVPVFMYSHAPQALRLRRQAAAAIAKQQRRHEEELHLLTRKGAAGGGARHSGAPMPRRYAITLALL